MRVLVGGALGDLAGIENGHVGAAAGPEHAAIGDAQRRRRGTGHLADGVLQGQEPEVADVVAKDAREGSIKTRVRPPLAGDAVGGHGISVGADEHVGRGDEGADVVLGHRGHQHPGLATVGDDVVEGGGEGIDAPLARHVGDGAPGVLRQVGRDRDAHRVPRRDAPEVVEAVGLDVDRQAGPHVRLAKAPEHGVDAALLQPGRQQVDQRIARRRVGVGVAVDGDAAPARRRQGLEQAPGAAPVVGAG